MSQYRILLGEDDRVGEWVFSRTSEHSVWVPGTGRAIGFEKNSELIAGVAYFLYNGVNVWTAIAQVDHRWINRTTLWAIFAYPFTQLKVKRISALVDASNTRSRRFIEHLGFQHEATLVGASDRGGDQLVYRMFERECRWLQNLRYRGDRRQREGAASTRLPAAGAGAGTTQH